MLAQLPYMGLPLMWISETAQSFDLPAILDVKWEAFTVYYPTEYYTDIYRSHSRQLNPRLAIADAVGCVRFYELANEANEDKVRLSRL